MGKIKTIRHNPRTEAVTDRLAQLAQPWVEELGALMSRLAGVLVRAVLVMLMVATPSLLLPGVTDDTRQMVALIALLLGALVVIEYASEYPSIVEFRHAPPFNRIRFLSLFVTVFLLSLIILGENAPSKISHFTYLVGALIGGALDVDYSPVRMLALAVSGGPENPIYELVRATAGIAYLVSLLSLCAFVVALRKNVWPDPRQGFNVWINLPTFDPSAGGDVVNRLVRDGRVNIALGFLLPFLTPAVAQAAIGGVGLSDGDNPQLLIWITVIWSFLPASLMMRGIAMGRVADLIRAQRERLERLDPKSGVQPA